MDQPKRLTRSKDKMLAGVCAGLGNYFDIDPTIVRLAFAFFGFAGGAAIFVYLIMWIIVPEEKIF